MIKLRQTTLDDVSAILEIYEASRRFMRLSGNPSQWTNGYPGKSDILRDIKENHGYVLYDESGILATFHLSLKCDPSYAIIEGGWHSNEDYGVIHRIAVAEHAMGKGLATRCLEEAEKIILKNGRRWLRVDTHKDNLPMQGVILKNGFLYCGIIYVLSTNVSRLAYDKKLG